MPDTEKTHAAVFVRTASGQPLYAPEALIEATGPGTLLITPQGPDSRIDEIRARHEAATPGPYGTRRDLDGTYTIQHGTYVTTENGFGSDGDVAMLVGDEQTAYNNGTFLARAREDVPYLLARVAELEAALAAAKEA